MPLAAHGGGGGALGVLRGAPEVARSHLNSVQSGGTATNQLEAKEICMGFTVQVGL